jgi:CelD/BcsL family acetyltransferase involved in cellulose biosynthesis
MQSLTIDPLRDPRWPSLIEASPQANVFHHPAWLRLLSVRYGYPMSAVCIAAPDGRPLAGLPLARVESRLTGNRLVALPFSDRCRPAYAEATPPGDVQQALGDALVAEHRRSALDIHLHDHVPGLTGAWTLTDSVEHRLALEPDVARVRAGFSKSQVRRGIAKARREGVSISRRTDVGALDEFYALHLLTRRRQGVPTQPRRFIRGLAGLFREGLGFVLLAQWQAKPIAAAVFLTYGGTLTYKYGASARQHLDKRPNNLLFDEAIRLGCESGAHTLDFGKTDRANAGLRSFKSAWGAEEEDLHYSYLSARPPRAGRGRADRILGWTVRRSPPTVGRLVGTLLYRHAA